MKRTISLLLILCIIISLTGCLSSSGRTFSYYLGGTVKNLDPQTATSPYALQVLSSIFEGLCQLDSSNNAIPGVAKSWESDATNTVYTFHLRKDARWSDGTNITASDFVFAFRRAVEPTTGASNANDMFIIKNARSIYNGVMDENELGAEAVDEYTLKVELESSSTTFPALTASCKFFPCNEAFFRSTSGRYGLAAKYLITNGPFCFSSNYSWESGEKITLSRFNKYNGDNKAKPSALIYIMNDQDNITADPVSALKNGKADIMRVTKDQAQSAADEGCTVYSFSNAVSGLIFNTDSTYISNQDLRELFVKTVNRDSLYLNLPEEITEATDIIPDSLIFGTGKFRDQAESQLYVKQDNTITSKISSIINELGTSSIPSVTLLCKNDDLSLAIANSILVSWNTNIGGYFNILPLDETSYEKKIDNRDYQIALYTVESTGSDPYSFLDSFESTASPKLLSNDSFDTLLQTMDNTVENYVNLEKFLNNQYIFYPIYKEQTYYAEAMKVSGINVTVGKIDFTNATK
jgi:oligopeptide transport system substrate-binding protein